MTSSLSIASVLGLARDGGVDRLDAQLMLTHLLGQGRAWLMAHPEAFLSADQAAALRTLMQRRAAGEPLAYVIGECEFRGLRLEVSPAVLIPRPETELLVNWALERLDRLSSRRVVDFGTGSGAVALALATACPSAEVWATDISDTALAVAKGNGARLGLEVRWHHGDWWQSLPELPFDLVVSNPPYVAEADPHLLDLAYEPRLALTPEGDGLSALRTLIQAAPRHLAPGAWVLLEHGHDQARAVQDLFDQVGFDSVQTRVDLAGLPRCTGGRWPGAGHTA